MIDHFAAHRRAQNCIAQGYLTNSKRPESLVKGVYPTHVTRGLGAFLWDTAGKRYLDFICGLGTSLLGYANERVNGAVAEQMRRGATHSLASTTELEAAEKLKELFPFVDAVKFLKSGSEACSAATRIARAATGRHLVLSEGYHGWHDQFTCLVPPAIGVPPSLAASIERFTGPEQIDRNVAAVIVEPVITDWSRGRIEQLKALREACDKVGALLIFDEVITGFRFPKFSVASYFGVTPDLICLGKAIANGLPLAAVGGKYAVMNCDEYFVSSSYAGETLSLAAAVTTMTLLQTKVFDLETLWQKGDGFLKRFNAMAEGLLRIDGYPTRGAFAGEPMAKGLFWQEACKAGLLFGPSWFLSFPAADELPNVMGTLEAILGRIRRGEVRLEGELPRSPFAQRVREAR